MGSNANDQPDVWFGVGRLSDQSEASDAASSTAAVKLRILVDGDACPVKDEVYKVAARYRLPVGLVSNSFLRLPRDPLVRQTVVSAEPDAADDFIAERADALTIVITADILLADRCIKQAATVIAPNGKPFTENSIGTAVATRAIMAELRSAGDTVGGPPPFRKQDRSRFLSALDNAVVRLRRNAY